MADIRTARLRFSVSAVWPPAPCTGYRYRIKNDTQQMGIPDCRLKVAMGLLAIANVYDPPCGTFRKQSTGQLNRRGDIRPATFVVQQLKSRFGQLGI